MADAEEKPQAVPNVAKRRGLTFKSKKGLLAPPEIQEAAEPVRGIKPSAEVPKAVIRSLFAEKKVKAVTKTPSKPIPAAKTIAAPKPIAAKPVVTQEPVVAAEEDSGLLELLEEQEAAPTVSTTPESIGEEFEEIAILIKEEEKKDLYGTTIPETYVPPTRRGFSEFIKLQYKPYILTDKMKVNPTDKFYKYQEFVRDYMRNAAPYRGILVYHGLGSGKTCTAIAAAEALFATSKKNIIVMSPKSLKKNFLREVSMCGFRHFQLNNFWLKLAKSEPTAMFFANTVLGISAAHLKRVEHIWIPDFRRPQSETNYDSLSPEERQEIRAQILSIVEYDPKTNPTGRIKFISYNGISAKDLMIMACDPSYKKFFDDAVIVVDEIHNLIRTIHGTIEPYIIDTKADMKGKRKLPPEPITPDRWDPAPQMRKNLEKLLTETREEKAARKIRKEKIELYTRGYMFYRLLVDARHSKIIGLSGTPLINHPEEIGILSNVLHGYFTMIEGVIAQTGSEIQKRVEELARAHPFTDFVEAKLEPAGGTRLVVSLLPEDVIKVTNESGVTHLPSVTQSEAYLSIYSAISVLYEDGKSPAKEEVVGAARSGYEANEFIPFEEIQRAVLEIYSTTAAPSKKQICDEIIRLYSEAYTPRSIIKSLERMFKAAGLAFSDTPVARAESLLPPMADDYVTNGRQYRGFRTHFIPNKMNLINKGTLVTRLTGLVSFYKGSSLELMPRVERDEVVRVPMSDYVQRSYSEKRVEELKKELEADKGATVDKAWKAVYDMKDTAASNNFKMGSRQACNFAFPPEVTRPRPVNKKEEELEALAGVEKEELVTLGEDMPVDWNEFPELKEEEKEEEDEDEVVSEDTVVRAATAKPPVAKPATVAKPAGPQRLGKSLAEIRAEKAAAKAAKPPGQQGGETPTAEAAEKAVEVADKAAEEAVEATEEAMEAAEEAEEGAEKAVEAAEAVEAAGEESIATACKVGRKLGEKMPVAVERATQCFRDMSIAGKRLLLDGNDGLRTYSPKYAAMLERIAAAPGSSLVYSAFLNLEGIGLFRVAMDVNGYAPIELTLTGGTLRFSAETEKSLRLGPGKQPRYLSFTGGEGEDVRAAALSIFNAKFSELPESMNRILTESGYTDNKVGELCRVFCITSAGAEGLSLRNVRAVHVMEPYWNEVRVRQVKGRAIRIGSHLDLPVEDRNVSIYTYVSVFSDDAQGNKVPSKRIDQSILIHDSTTAQSATDMGIRVKPGATSYVVTTDEFFYSISERKRRVIEAIECILKSAAIDCEINMRKNKEETFMCLPLKGSRAEYIYNPDLEIDILNVPQFEGIDIEKACTGEPVSTMAKSGVAPAKSKVKDIFRALKGVTYRMRPVMGADDEILRFDMYEADQGDPTKKIPEKLLGTAGVKNGNPAPPVKLL